MDCVGVLDVVVDDEACDGDVVLSEDVYGHGGVVECA